MMRMPRQLPWKLRCTVALLLAAGCGGGSAGPRPQATGGPDAPTPTPIAAPTPTAAAACSGPFDDGEVFVTVLELLGAPSRNGLGNTPSIPFRTWKRVLVRTHLGQVDVLDFAGDGAPEWRGPIYFSSPDVAWSWSAGFLVPEAPSPTGAVLLRSDDAGVTWHTVSPISGAERRLDVVVDEESARGWTLGTYESRASFGTPGPFVFAGSIATDRWQQIDEVPVGEFLKPVWMGLGTRGGRVEVVRWWPALELYDVTDPDTVTVSRIDAPDAFQPNEYATYGDRGWIAGVLGGQPQILVSGADGAWDAVPVADVAQGSISWLDFADAQHGFACGWELIPSAPDGARFCVFSDDGGRSWARGDVPQGMALLGVARSRCRDGGVAASSSPWWGSPSAEVLTTVDGGRTWSSEALPRLGDSMQMGPTVANSRTGESTRGVPLPEASPIALPPPAPEIPADAPGPILWAAGDSVAYGPAILGLLLRSDDGGQTWIEALGRPGGSFRDVDFVDRRTGWVVGGGRILRTDDGGASFVDQTANVELDGPLSEARVVSAADASHAIVVGNGRPAGADYTRDIVLFTSDGGASWRVADVPATEFPPVLGKACLTTGGSGMLIVDSLGATTADAGATWTFGADFPNGPPFQFNDPGLECSGRSDLWILAEGRDDDTLWHSPNGGRTWTNLIREVGLVAWSWARTVGTFLSSGDGWLVVEESDAVAIPVRTRDGGRTWTELPSPFAPRQHAETLAFGENGTGVVLTTDRVAWRTTDGGASWSAGVLPGGFMPLAMDAVP